MSPDYILILSTIAAIAERNGFPAISQLRLAGELPRRLAGATALGRALAVLQARGAVQFVFAKTAHAGWTLTQQGHDVVNNA